MRKVLADLLDHSLRKLREATLRNPKFDRTSAVWDAIRRDSSFSFGSFMLLSSMKCILQKGTWIAWRFCSRRMQMSVLKTIADARPRNLLCQMRTVLAARRSVIA